MRICGSAACEVQHMGMAEETAQVLKVMNTLRSTSGCLGASLVSNVDVYHFRTVSYLITSDHIIISDHRISEILCTYSEFRTRLYSSF